MIVILLRVKSMKRFNKMKISLVVVVTVFAVTGNCGSSWAATSVIVTGGDIGQTLDPFTLTITSVPTRTSRTSASTSVPSANTTTITSVSTNTSSTQAHTIMITPMTPVSTGTSSTSAFASVPSANTTASDSTQASGGTLGSRPLVRPWVIVPYLVPLRSPCKPGW